jgi:enterochelin esterase-like enzyme
MKAAKTFRSVAILLLALPVNATAQDTRLAITSESKPIPEMPAVVVERYQKNQNSDESMSKPSASDKHFLEQLKSGASPVITGRWVTFVYRGDARDLELVGEMTDWNKRGLKLEPLEGTNIKYLSMQFPADARIEYKYIIDGKWELDRLNPDKKDNGVGGENNFFTLPEYQPGKETRERERVRRGQIQTLKLAAGAATTERAIRIYLPPGYAESKERYPTVYFGDGIEYIDRAHAAIIADNLIADRRMRPVIMVFVAPVDRMKEYRMNDAYINWLVKELVPAVDSKYRTVAAAGSRAIGGASLGGLISAYAAYRHPEIFGNVIGQSSAFQVNAGRIIADYSAQERKPIRWYLETGRYEGC